MKILILYLLFIILLYFYLNKQNVMLMDTQLSNVKEFKYKHKNM